MGCEWRMELCYEDVDKDIPLDPLLEHCFEKFEEVDDDGDNIALNFYASYGFSIQEWYLENKELIDKYKGMVVYLYCLEHDPDESFEVK